MYDKHLYHSLLIVLFLLNIINLEQGKALYQNYKNRFKI